MSPDASDSESTIPDQHRSYHSAKPQLSPHTTPSTPSSQASNHTPPAPRKQDISNPSNWPHTPKPSPTDPHRSPWPSQHAPPRLHSTPEPTPYSPCDFQSVTNLPACSTIEPEYSETSPASAPDTMASAYQPACTIPGLDLES